MNVCDITTETETSISTVSRVLNNKRDVSPKIRDRVETVLEEYDYKPGTIARGTVSKTMKNIAVLTTDVQATRYARMIYAIGQELNNLGYNVSVCNIGGSIQECNRYSEILSEKQTDGIVLIRSVFNELIKYPEITAKIRDTLVVIADGQVKLLNFYPILVDDTKAARVASDYIFDHGRMDLSYVLDTAADSGRAERQSFLEAVKLRDVPDGNDQVPEDIAITGYNNSPDSRVCELELATPGNKPEPLGGVCASFLRDRVEGKESATSVAIQLEPVMRGSESFWGNG